MQGLCSEETVLSRRGGDVNLENLVSGELTDKSQTIKVKRWHSKFCLLSQWATPFFICNPPIEGQGFLEGRGGLSPEDFWRDLWNKQ